MKLKRTILFFMLLGIILGTNVTYADLIAHWQFENGGIDSSGNALTANESGNVVFQQDSSQTALDALGTSAYFDGSSSNELKVDYDSLLNVTTSYTFAMWVKPNGSFGSLLGRYSNAGGNSYGLYINPGNHTIGPIMYGTPTGF